MQPLSPPLAGSLSRFLVLLACAFSLAGCQSVFSGLDTSARAATASASGQIAEIRSRGGLPPLRPDRELERAALVQAVNMASAGRMVHDTGWRRDFASRMRATGVGGAAAENIAHGRFDTAQVIAVWMGSPGHRRNMLDERFSRFGLAYAVDPSDGERRYWAMVLGQ